MANGPTTETSNKRVRPPPLSPPSICPRFFAPSVPFQTVDFDAQDDSFMAKILVEAGAQDIPVGTPIFVTVDDAEFVSAFKDFEVAAELATPAEAIASETVAVAEPAPAPVAVEEKKVAAAPAPVVAAEPVPVAVAAVSAVSETPGELHYLIVGMFRVLVLVLVLVLVYAYEK